MVLDKVKGEITFFDVDFAIEGNEILKDVSFVIPAGKTLGIMGATGSGQSSIINLMQRFYDVQSGSVRLDGVDVRELAIKQLRENIAVVMQDVFLFSDTIEENIKMGRRDTMPMEEIKAAAVSAQASGFIEDMDQQYVSSAWRTAEIRCAMITLVVAFISFNIFWISCSVSMSKAEVESSITRTGQCFDNARAILIRCFCPPDRPTPRSPTTVSYC